MAAGRSVDAPLEDDGHLSRHVLAGLYEGCADNLNPESWAAVCCSRVHAHLGG